MRPRINERLGRAAQYPITLIVAPAGFGKTIALRDYLDAARRDTVYCGIRREDSTVVAFAKLLANALEPLDPGAAASFAGLLERGTSNGDDVDSMLEWFEGHLAGLACTVAIDDLHHAAQDPRTAQFTCALIERSPASVNWIIATRTDVGLPVASWLGYGRMDVPVGEDDLRLTKEEVLEAASARNALASTDVDELYALTGGWPVALGLALQTRVRASDVSATTAGTRDLLYRYLAEQVFARLSERAKVILLETSVLPSFETKIAEALGISRDELASLRRDVSFLSESAPGMFRYHDLFRDFLEAELQREGPRRWSATLQRVGAALETCADDLGALRIYTRAAARDPIVRILHRSGTHLFERGSAEVLEQALASLDDEQRLDSALLGLQAMLEAARGHFEIAERDFVDAIARASDEDVRFSLVHRFSIELIRHERDAIAWLEPYVNAPNLAPRRRVSMIATLATALAREGRIDDAMERIRAGIAAIDGSVDDDTRARFYQQAAFVHHLSPHRGHAWDYANLAIELALKQSLHDVAARAFSVLYIIVYDDEDDPLESLALLERLTEAARKAGSVQTRLYGLIASYEIEVERGNDGAADRLERELERASGMLLQTRAETLLPARAMRAASGGNFRHAFALLEGTGAAQAGSERRALREAEIALYAYASGENELADAARAAALRALAECNVTRRTTRTRIMLALAELIRGHTGSAHRYITEAERAGTLRSRRLRSLVNAARAIYRRSLDQLEDRDVAAALERLRNDQFGGLARMLEALPFFHESDRGSYALLTPAERDILRALAEGRSSKEIAATTGRSPQTVDTHIRSICRKLQCSGRREAVALAVRSGWVHT